ncbi:hypothetical protein H4R20_001424 [Coemansia guatemalensis]|uniref:Uncharacterized protein n=1 Tax=Coemansia guatemalensis TaxID=2761395 RepID=A0A9W8HZL9_9FUNG|nr:hypothetical protein H4R20_001424 [Coemansia guatemalensis]
MPVRLNPRPHRRAETPLIKSHAILRCNNVTCEGRPVNSTTGDTVHRIINRDLAACMNFRHIVKGLRDHGSVPERFTRPGRAGDVPAVAPNGGGMAPDDGPPARRQRTE